LEWVTIEYVPIFRSVEDVTSDYWIDVLRKLSLALVKIALGRIRTRFTQTNTLLPMDGEKILQEGTEEYKEIMEKLEKASCHFYPLD